MIMETEHLYFTKVSENLINDYLEMVNDLDNLRLISKKNRTFSYEDELKWVKNKLINNEEVYSIMEKGTDKFVGNIEIMNITNDDCMVGICLTKAYQNRHYGSEAMKRIIQYAFEELSVKEVKLAVFKNNGRAIKCYENVGFKIINENDDEYFMGLCK